MITHTHRGQFPTDKLIDGVLEQKTKKGLLQGSFIAGSPVHLKYNLIYTHTKILFIFVGRQIYEIK